MKLINKITNLYLYFILIIFVLSIDSSLYSNILNFKWNIYVYTTVIYILIILIISMIKILNKSINIKEFRFNKTYLFAFIYIVAMVISTILSPYRDANLLLGSPRMEGLIVNIIYVVSFMVISLTYKFDKKIIYVLFIPSIIMGIMILIQSLFFKNAVCGGDYCYGTIGNVDTIGLLYTMYITIASMLFILKNSINKIFLLLTIIISLIVMMIINVTSMYVTLFIILLLILPYICLKSKYLFRYLIVIGLICIIVLLFHFCYFYFLLPIIVLITLIIIILYKNDYNIMGKKNVIISYIILCLFIPVIIYELYVIDFKSGFLFEVHSILHGNLNDNFGTTRLFLWKRTIKMINHKYILFGYGIDTYYISFMNKYLKDLIETGYVTIQDTACNIYLTKLVNIGLVGLISFITFILSIIKNFINNKKNIISACLLVGIISYLIQGLFNIEVVIATPIFYILLSLYISTIK